MTSMCDEVRQQQQQQHQASLPPGAGTVEGGGGGGGNNGAGTVFESLQPPCWEEGLPQITKEVLVVPEVGEVGMLLRGVLTPAECAHFIEQVEGSLAMLRASNSSKYRNCFRAEVSVRSVPRATGHQVCAGVSNWRCAVLRGYLTMHYCIISHYNAGNVRVSCCHDLCSNTTILGRRNRRYRRDNNHPQRFWRRLQRDVGSVRI